MDVSVLNGSAANAVVGSLPATSDDFETFLRMLTTQVKNQDPLSPMAADQFSDQLAAFSMVEQQSLTNQKMDSLISALVSKNISTYSSVIGRMAYHEKSFAFSGDSIALQFGELRDIEEDLKVSILNSEGIAIFEQPLLQKQDAVNWDGTDNFGRQVPGGSYTAELRRIIDNARVDVTVSTGNIVEEVQFGNAEVELLLADGMIILESEVSKLR
ncbi:MAG: flagellar hook capping FlgD N-terminal domain-containing protein [Pelagibaca sp.]